MQPRSTLSEDCLTLNVYAGPAARAPAPVLFWIFGGGFQGGGGNETRLNGTWDAALLRGELVIVTSNYRLGAFGWASPVRGLANFGLKDQREAMRYVKVP